jgi:hypothetical protein
MGVWKEESVAAVREFVESAVGPDSRNEYFGTGEREGVNLPSSVRTG